MQSASEVAENVREMGEQLFPLTNKASQFEQCYTHTQAHIDATFIHEHTHTHLFMLMHRKIMSSALEI